MTISRYGVKTPHLAFYLPSYGILKILFLVKFSGMDLSEALKSIAERHALGQHEGCSPEFCLNERSASGSEESPTFTAEEVRVEILEDEEDGEDDVYDDDENGWTHLVAGSTPPSYRNSSDRLGRKRRSTSQVFPNTGARYSSAALSGLYSMRKTDGEGTWNVSRLKARGNDAEGQCGRQDGRQVTRKETSKRVTVLGIPVYQSVRTTLGDSAAAQRS